MTQFILVLAFLAAATSPVENEATAARCGDKMQSMPDFYQADKTYGQLPRGGSAYCGPTAAANAIVWLDANGFGDLLPAADPGPKDQFELIRALGSAQFMKTDPVKGIGPVGVMKGLKRYCAERGYRVVAEYAGWRTRVNRVSERPGIEWMRRGVAGKANLLLNIGWYTTDDDGKGHTRIGGHYLTVVGYEVRGGKTWLTIHDPAKRNHPAQRDSLTRCPVKCLLKPLAAGTTLRKKKDGDIFAGDGLFVLDGIRLKKGADLAIIDGAIAFTLLAESL